MICMDCLTLENGTDTLSEMSVTTTILTFLFTYFMKQCPSWEANPFFSLSRNSPRFRGPEGSLQHSQGLATCPYPEPARSSPYPYTLLPEGPSEYYPPIYAWVSQVTTIIRRVIFQKSEDLIHTAEEAWNHTCTVVTVTDRVSDIQANRVKTVRIEQATAVEQHLWTKCIQTRQNVRHDQPINNCYWQTRSCLQWANLEANSCASTTTIRGILLKSLLKYGFFHTVPKRKFGITCNVT